MFLRSFAGARALCAPARRSSSSLKPQNFRGVKRNLSTAPPSSKPAPPKGDPEPSYDWKSAAIISPVILAGLAIIADKSLNEQRGFWGAYRALSDAVMPLMRMLDPETAHGLAVRLASAGLTPRDTGTPHYAELETEVFGLKFPSAIGLAAGFDKNAEAVDALLRMGFGFVEIGSVTPHPQPGNPKPRMFRLLEDRALINRCGFNSDGIVKVKERLEERERLRSLGRSMGAGLLGVNVGKNKWVEEAAAAEDFCHGIRHLGPFADYLVVNISSPNTPGLRLLQRREAMQSLVVAALAARDETQTASGKPALPLLIKIAPDLDDEQKEDIAAVALATKVDGLIVTNTTVSRPDTLQSPLKEEAGGLSGAPLRELATKTIYDMYRLTQGRLPLVGVGGIATGADAYEKIKAGASVVQIYSMLVYDGPGAVVKIKKELAELLAKDGYKSVAQAVGVAHPREEFAKQVAVKGAKKLGDEAVKERKRRWYFLWLK